MPSGGSIMPGGVGAGELADIETILDDLNDKTFTLVRGASVNALIVAVEGRLDLTGLGTYPFLVELDAQGAETYVKQGDSTVTLGGSLTRIGADEWVLVTVTSADRGYVAIQRTGAVNGTLVATLVGVLT